MSDGFSHLKDGQPSMVDVGDKRITKRVAKARAVVYLPSEVLEQFVDGELHGKKGPVFHTAILAGVMAAKKTHEIIPLCHPLAFDKCDIEIDQVAEKTVIMATVGITGKTGVEMEALTAATAAALTIYDMCKGVSHNIVIGDIELIQKSGGKRNINKTI